MEGVPAQIDIHQVSSEMSTLDSVLSIHDLHIWTLSSGVTALSAHIHIHEMSNWQNILVELRALLKKDFNIDHITLQPEPDIMDCKPCQISKCD